MTQEFTREQLEESFERMIDQFDEIGFGVQDLYQEHDGCYDNDAESIERHEKFKALDLGEIKEVHSERNGYDYDNQVTVYYFPKCGVYIMFQGYYSSHSGTSYDGDFFHVHPVVVTKTDYLTFD